jgi:hypothetical protein
MDRADNEERRPRQDGVPDALGDGTAASIIVRHLTCPCGCMTVPGVVDDPDCIRYRPRPAPIDWPVYDVLSLGLAEHDRATCQACQAGAR